MPQGILPGEETSPTQPFPTKPPAFDRQGITTDDLIDFTPQLRAEAIEITRRYIIGPIFTPPSIKSDSGTLQMPGATGGAEWGGAPFDPETKIMYVPSITGTFAAAMILASD